MFRILLDFLAKESKISLRRVNSHILFSVCYNVGCFFPGVHFPAKRVHSWIRYIQCAAYQGIRFCHLSFLTIIALPHQQCLPVLLLSLEHCDPDEEVHCLQALSSLISSAWPRIPSHKMAILKALSKVVNSELLTRKQDILCLVVECLTLLMRACPELKVSCMIRWRLHVYIIKHIQTLSPISCTYILMYIARVVVSNVCFCLFLYQEGYHWLEKSCSHETMQYCLQQTFLGAGNSLWSQFTISYYMYCTWG